jgi:hypothetical protein
MQLSAAQIPPLFSTRNSLTGASLGATGNFGKALKA